MSKSNEWRVIQFKGYIFLVSPEGHVHREYDLEEAHTLARAENAALELRLLVKEGKI
jgi:hypothetical protein